MQLNEMIQQHTAQLPPQLQAEVFDFVLFLEQKLKSTTKQSAKKNRPFGLCAGEFRVPDDFDAPLSDDILNLFE